MKATNDDLGGTVREHLTESAEIQHKVADKCVESILAVARLIIDSFRSGGKVLLCGNGGSAADCQHMATELVSRLTKEFDRPGLPALALTTDTSILTAIANDSGFEEVFERQVRTLGKPGDVLVGISTSGNSANILRAAGAARESGMKTVSLQGQGGALAALADYSITIPSSDTQHIQEALLSVEHILCYLVERGLFGQRTH
jgi:D-sedoheptulose 7-phosphate isomerase